MLPAADSDSLSPSHPVGRLGHLESVGPKCLDCFLDRSFFHNVGPYAGVRSLPPPAAVNQFESHAGNDREMSLQ